MTEEMKQAILMALKNLSDVDSINYAYDTSLNALSVNIDLPLDVVEAYIPKIREGEEKTKESYLDMYERGELNANELLKKLRKQ